MRRRRVVRALAVRTQDRRARVRRAMPRQLVVLAGFAATGAVRVARGAADAGRDAALLVKALSRLSGNEKRNLLSTRGGGADLSPLRLPHVNFIFLCGGGDA
ncbi:hypothetical protein ZWY2020_042220 [Hordeum vulgare]|nr:hypothetical protein ZWY2020_042220 [Hordeum vulgare]